MLIPEGIAPTPPEPKDGPIERIEREVAYDVRTYAEFTPTDMMEHLAEEQTALLREGLVQAKKFRDQGADPGESFILGLTFCYESMRLKRIRDDFKVIKDASLSDVGYIDEADSTLDAPVISDIDNILPIEKAKKRRMNPIRLWLGGIAAALSVKNKPKPAHLEEI